jgi:hypothetical protein
LFLRPGDNPRLGGEDYRLSIFWQITGALCRPSGCIAPIGFTATTGRGRQGIVPQAHPAEDFDGGKIICCLLGRPPKDERDLYLEGSILANDDSRKPFRFVPPKGLGTEWIVTTNPDWGCCFMTERRPGPRRGTCTFTIALSTTFVEYGWRLAVVDANDREHEPTFTSGGWSPTPSGRLMVMVLEVNLPPEDVAGVAIYHPRHAKIDWGKVRIPPEE